MFTAEVISVSELGKWRVDTGAEGLFVCRDMLVSLNPEVKWENSSVLELVFSKWLGNDVDIVVTHTKGGVPIVLVSLDDSEGIDTEELSSCSLLMVFMLVTVKLEEKCSFSVSVVTSDKPSISSDVLFKFGGKLIPVSKLLSNISVVLSNSEVGNEDLGKEVEFELCGNRGEAEVVLVVIVNKEEAVLFDERVSGDTVYWA